MKRLNFVWRNRFLSCLCCFFFLVLFFDYVEVIVELFRFGKIVG